MMDVFSKNRIILVYNKTFRLYLEKAKVTHSYIEKIDQKTLHIFEYVQQEGNRIISIN